MSGEPPIGTIGVVSTAHASSLLVRFVSWAIRFDTESPVNHAFIAAGDGHILEARPRGSGFNLWDAYPGTIWLTSITPPAQPFTKQDRAAQSLCGVPYGFLDILAIGIAQKRWDPDLAQQWDDGHEPWWVRRAADDGTSICSELCVRYYDKLGIKLFPERPPGLVSPGDLWRLNQSLAPRR